MNDQRAYSSARLERFADNEEVGGSSPPRPTGFRRRITPARKVPVTALIRILLAAVVAVGAAVAWSRFRGEVWHCIPEETEQPAGRRVEGP